MRSAARIVLAAILLSAGAAAQQAPAPDIAIIGVGLKVSDLERAIKFYTAGLGMTVVATMGTPENKETVLGLSRSPTEPRIILLSGTSAAPPASGAAGFGRVIFRVVDVAAVRARLMAAGYAVGDIRTAPTGHRVLIVSDPDGYGLELVTNPK